MSDIALKVENLSKRYRINVKEALPETLVGVMMSWLKSPLHNFRQLRQLSHFSDNGQTSDDIIWALKDVSFEVKQGEVVGIIGSNGAGKSTLLKILSHITEPTSGRAIINGRISSLLEVGTGFHPELSGRENVYLNGSILGMTKAEIDRKFDEIVYFSGVKKFIDTPVKRYSSGMQVRLAFAVAAYLEPEILLVDEVLAVGDLSFQRRCMGKMEKIAEGGKTVLIVSHNMAAVLGLCSECILFEGGAIKAQGSTSEIVKQYQQITTDSHSTYPAVVSSNEDTGGFSILGVSFFNKRGTATTEFRTGTHLIIKIRLQTPGNGEAFAAGVAIFSHDGIYCYGSNTFLDNVSLKARHKVLTVSFTCDNLNLLDGIYTVSVSITNNSATYIYEHHPRQYYFSVKSVYHDHGMFYLPHAWSAKADNEVFASDNSITGSTE